MATSGSRDFDLDVAEIIEEAYERCGLELRTGYDAKTARRSMNLMFADWANRGLNLWTVKQGTQALTAGTATYTFTSDYADLLEVVVRRSGVDYELSRMSRGEYLTLPNKTTQGRPSHYYYNRQISPQITTDAPCRFLPCMVAGLAYYLSLKRAPERVQMLKTIYEEEFQRAADEDVDAVPLKLQPSISYLRVN